MSTTVSPTVFCEDAFKSTKDDVVFFVIHTVVPVSYKDLSTLMVAEKTYRLSNSFLQYCMQTVENFQVVCQGPCCDFLATLADRRMEPCDFLKHPYGGDLLRSSVDKSSLNGHNEMNQFLIYYLENLDTFIQVVWLGSLSICIVEVLKKNGAKLKYMRKLLSQLPFSNIL